MFLRVQIWREPKVAFDGTTLRQVCPPCIDIAGWTARVIKLWVTLEGGGWYFPGLLCPTSPSVTREKLLGAAGEHR